MLLAVFVIAAAVRMPTSFEKSVHAVVKSIPKGKVASYGAVAEATGSGSARALVGFGGETSGEGLEKKRRLLEEEGVEFDKDGKVSRCSFVPSLKKPKDLRTATLELVPRRFGGDWREMMPAMRAVAKELAVEGLVDVTQKGVKVLDLDDIKGPYRLRLPL
ncbi:hypothetical protein CTAYLR_005565 [Chrysophaeum taylorii]|uniref:Methylated-DNA-[protein]-cysteine S-methyltransferase DNA binding domain-containing protein n=1 Tax=Chrysophaeum taylorii TaxID=2483200 RepID=A0AAD7U533_9STRA|nr:hypothetical protein CTAYLR_005565 [Chrysophaeum taylorii]